MALTVETEMNGDSKITNERVPYTWLVCFAHRAGTGDFFLTVHYFNFFVPIAQLARQAAVLGRISLSMCLWSELRTVCRYVLLQYICIKPTYGIAKNRQKSLNPS